MRDADMALQACASHDGFLRKPADTDRRVYRSSAQSTAAFARNCR